MTVESPMNIIEATHPLIKHKIGLMREKNINTKEFRELASEIGCFLTYQATSDFSLGDKTITSWSDNPLTVKRINEKMTIVPILRAGLGMMDGVLKALPHVSVSVVGLYRDEKTLEPIAYFQKFVKDISERTAIVIDPMLATGGSFIATVDYLKKAGCQKIIGLFLVAAPEGIENIKKTHPDVTIYTAAIDSHLNKQAYIIPGLGDAGDKIFGTR